MTMQRTTLFVLKYLSCLIFYINFYYFLVIKFKVIEKIKYIFKLLYLINHIIFIFQKSDFLIKQMINKI
jgi:hypothetical protein